MRFAKIYARFERAVAFLALAGMVVVILLALYAFLDTLWTVGGRLPGALDYAVFQSLFDRVLAAIIALEIAHSIREMVSGSHGRAQLRTVVVIGMLAVVRKLVVLEIGETSGLFLAGLAAVVLALGLVLFIINRVSETTPPPPAPGSDG
jgi:uncharacterized membrane protein (DUF373 family)